MEGILQCGSLYKPMVASLQKTRVNSVMTTLRKPDGSETSSIQETMNVMLDHLSTENTEQDTLHHKNIRRTIEETILTGDDLVFSREEIKHTIESFSDKNAPGIGGIYLRTFNTFPRLITAIYNQCLKEDAFQKGGK